MLCLVRNVTASSIQMKTCSPVPSLVGIHHNSLQIKSENQPVIASEDEANNSSDRNNNSDNNNDNNNLHDVSLKASASARLTFSFHFDSLSACQIRILLQAKFEDK